MSPAPACIIRVKAVSHLSLSALGESWVAAASVREIAFVVVRYFEGEPRTHVWPISLAKRYQALLTDIFVDLLREQQ